MKNILLFVFVCFSLSIGSFYLLSQKNNADKLLKEQKFNTSVTDSPTINPSPSTGIPNKNQEDSKKIENQKLPEKIISSCEEAQEFYNANTIFPDIKVSIENAKEKDQCLITRDSALSFLVPKGSRVLLAGAMAQALQISHDNKKILPFYLSSTPITEDSAVDFSDPTKVMITGHGVAPYLNKDSTLLSKNVLNLGKNKVTELTISNKYMGYLRNYVLIDKAHKILYEVSLNSETNNFVTQEIQLQISFIKSLFSSLTIN